MKKIFSFILAILLFTSTSSLISCSKGDKYELFSISGLGISKSSYEYNYIIFDFDNNTYEMKNKAKANGIITQQTGSFSFVTDYFISITNKEIPLQNYFLYSNELLLFSDDYSTFYVSATISGTKVTMILKNNKF